MILFYILFFIVILIFTIDFVPQFNTWQSRIHIGRETNPDIWKSKVLAVSKKWLKNTPTIKVTDNSRLIIIDILKGNYKRDAIQNWQEAALLLGLIQEFKSSKSENTKKAITEFLDSKINSNGNWINQPQEIDGVILAYALFSIPWLNHDKYKPAFDKIYELINNLKGDDGTIAYKKHNTNYRFVDTIGFICPFLVNYGVKYNHPEAIALSVKQITTFNTYGMLANQFIPCHTYTIDNKMPVGLFGWGRGLGWYAIGLIDSWTALPNNDSNKEILEQSVIAFAKMAMQFQNPNGSWNWLVINKQAQADSSTTATLSWFLLNAAQIESISQNCMAAKKKAISYLMKVTRRDGSIDFSQGDTKGIGIHSNEFDILPFAQGFALRSVFELNVEK